MGPVIDRIDINESVAGEWYVVRLHGGETDETDERLLTWIDIEIFEVPVFSVGNNTPSYYARNTFELSDGVTEDIDVAAPSITGFVKSDGCTQLWFHDEPIHFDHADELEAMFNALRDARRRALEIMGVS